MTSQKLPSFSLRHKIIIILACYILGILVISMVSQEDLATAKEKLEVVELAYSLNTQILEARRYEKNFFLYGTQDALTENKNQLELALVTVTQISNRVTRFKMQPMLNELRERILLYRAEINELGEHFQANHEDHNSSPAPPHLATTVSPAADLTTDELRVRGQEMTELSKELVHFEHLQIRSILNELVEQLVVWSIVAIGVGIFMPLVMSMKIFKPLRVIKEATEDIALGRFSKIEVLDTRDEMQQVMEAFNTMVAELERRQDQLVQSQKLSSIGTLTAGIAHQLNNPLNNISTSCQIAMDDFATGDQEMMRKMLRNIEQETYRARDVVQGLLEFSRAKEFSLREGNLLDIVNRTVKLVKSQVPAQIEMVINIPDNLVLPIDAQRIQEVLINMIINASHAIHGTGRITVSGWLDEPADEVIIEIADTGEGIPDEIKARLFDPFYTTKEEGKGTGLGLSIAYGIIEKHRGRISVTSTPGEGATFQIHLPHSNGQGDS
jgi:two-component system NtrC family sensor kinase